MWGAGRPTGYTVHSDLDRALTDIATQIDRALEGFLVMLREEPALRAEFEGSTDEFFRGALPSGDPRSVLLDAHRHVEWFVLERHSATLRNTPVEALHEAWVGRYPELAAAGEALLASFAGLFEVESVTPGEGMLLADIAGLVQYVVAEPEAAHAARVGDLIAGRLFPIGEGLHVISSAAGYFRDSVLAEAVRRDLEETRAARANKVLHVSQLEIESLFFGAGQIRPAEDPTAAARSLLERWNLLPEQIDAIFERLVRAPFDPKRWAHGARDELGTILDELAFETSIDLDEAQVVLLQAWSAIAHSRVDPVAPTSVPKAAQTPPAERNPRAAIAEFDRARESGAELEELFQKLERDLGLEGIPGEEEEEADELAPDFPGVVAAIVQEFLWETSLTDPAGARACACLEKLGRFGANLGVIEELDATTILRFATFWVLEYDELASVEEARDLVLALESFCAWAESAHGLDLGAVREPLATLHESLPRVWRANRARARSANEDPGTLVELLSIESSGKAELRDPAGTFHATTLPVALAQELVPGDRLRVRFEGGQCALVLCCYPPEIAILAAS